MRMAHRMFGQTRVYAVYQDCSDQHAVIDPQILTFDRSAPPSPAMRTLYRQQIGTFRAATMLRRLRRGIAILSLLPDGARIAAYGWLQTWRPFRRRFWWLTDDAICLGPCWTHPESRGRGLYSRMLSHTLAICRQRFSKRIIVWADADNIPSRRGIERAGFQSLGVHRISLYAMGLIRRHQVVSCAEVLDATTPGSRRTPPGRTANTPQE